VPRKGNSGTTKEINEWSYTRLDASDRSDVMGGVTVKTSRGGARGRNIRKEERETNLGENIGSRT